MKVRQLTGADAAVVAGWSYEGPWAVYDPRPDGPPLRPEDGYVAVVDDEAEGEPLVGFACVGAEARVPGLPERGGVADIGVGMRPDLVGRGLGPRFAGAVIDHVRRSAGDARRLRAVVQEWNERSIRLTRRLGFELVGVHDCEQGGRTVRYAVLERDLDRADRAAQPAGDR